MTEKVIYKDKYQEGQSTINNNQSLNSNLDPPDLRDPSLRVVITEQLSCWTCYTGDYYDQMKIRGKNLHEPDAACCDNTLHLTLARTDHTVQPY